jgi:hypothetical protein
MEKTEGIDELDEDKSDLNKQQSKVESLSY